MGANPLERCLVAGVAKAHRRYLAMTGYWLWHAPESFVMASTAIHVDGKFGADVYVDCTTKKIKRTAQTVRGRPHKRKRRYDLVIWKKASPRVRAVVEIKKTDTIGSLWSDRRKLYRYIRRNKNVAGYLLVYTEAVGENRKKRLERIRERAERWEKALHSRLVERRESANSDYKDEYDWAIFLFRIKPRVRKRA